MSDHFADHKMRRETGWTWLCRKPDTSIYLFRVTWCPCNLVVTGDCGDIVITHYSFADPWSAAAWVNGAEWSYFMEKSHASKEYDPEATAEHIVEMAYRNLRDDRENTKLFESILDNGYGWGEADNPGSRKDACRELLGSDDLSVDKAYSITGDSEDLIHCYPEKFRIMHEALQWWGARMWETEPAWHKAVRVWRRLRGEVRDLRRFPIVLSPIRYAIYDDKGRPTHFNGATYWRWHKRAERRVYQALSPARVLGLDLSRLGLWRLQGSSWPDSGRSTDQWGRPTNEGRFEEARA